MKTIELSDGFPRLEELLALANLENIILRLSDGQEFLVAEINDFDREIELTRQNEELMAFLDERSEEAGMFSPDQVRDMLDLND